LRFVARAGEIESVADDALDSVTGKTAVCTATFGVMILMNEPPTWAYSPSVFSRTTTHIDVRRPTDFSKGEAHRETRTAAGRFANLIESAGESEVSSPNQRDVVWNFRMAEPRQAESHRVFAECRWHRAAFMRPCSKNSSAHQSLRLGLVALRSMRGNFFGATAKGRRATSRPMPVAGNQR